MDLTPGDRITLIKRIGEALQGDALPDLDLTLDTFGIPGSVAPNYDIDQEKYEYVLRRMAHAADPVVVGVHAYLYPDAASEVGSIAVEPLPAGPWKEGEFRLFLSHTDAHKVLAGQIRTRLADYGIDTYVAHDNIKPTSQWQDEIEAALMTCDALVALLTPDFIESRWCDQEVGAVFGRRRCIVGVKQGAVPHGFIGKYQAVNGDESTYAAWEIAGRIVDALWINAQTRPLMARPAVVAYAQSTSFDNARGNYARVLELHAAEWTDEMVAMAEGAAEENRQVGEAILLSDDADNGKPIPEHLVEHLDRLLDRKPSPEPTSASTFDFGGGSTSDDDIPF